MVYRTEAPYTPRYNQSDRMKPWEPPGLIQNKIAKNILLTLGITAGVALFMLSPYGLHFLVKGTIGAAFRKRDFNREAIRLKKKGYIALTKTPEGWIVKLLKKGKKRLKNAKLETMKLPKERKWDKKWRLFIFDIPEKSRISRDLLRMKLKELGMCNIQRSVFAYPYDCRGELVFISDYYGVTKYCTYAEVGYSDIDKELRKHFTAKKLI